MKMHTAQAVTGSGHRGDRRGGPLWRLRHPARAKRDFAGLHQLPEPLDLFRSLDSHSIWRKLRPLVPEALVVVEVKNKADNDSVIVRTLSQA